MYEGLFFEILNIVPQVGYLFVHLLGTLVEIKAMKWKLFHKNSIKVYILLRLPSRRLVHILLLFLMMLISCPISIHVGLLVKDSLFAVPMYSKTWLTYKAKLVCFELLFFNIIHLIQLCDKKNLSFVDCLDTIILNSS